MHTVCTSGRINYIVSLIAIPVLPVWLKQDRGFFGLLNEIIAKGNYPAVGIK